MCTMASRLPGVGAADDQPKTFGQEFRDQAHVIAKNPEHECGRSAWEAEVAKLIRRSPADRRALRHQFRTSLPDYATQTFECGCLQLQAGDFAQGTLSACTVTWWCSSSWLAYLAQDTPKQVRSRHTQVQLVTQQ